MPTPTPEADAQGAKAALPRALIELETAAEDVVSTVDYSDWAAARQIVDTIKKDLAALGPDFRTAGIPTNLTDGIRTPLASLERKVDPKNAMETKALAVQIIGAMPDILDNFQVTMPTDLNRLDYLGYAVALNAQKGDWTAAANNIGECPGSLAKLHCFSF